MGKSGTQRQVLALRTLVAQALSDLEDSDGDGAESACDKLREADTKFRDLERNISTVAPRQIPTLPVASSDVPRETGRWLFTEFQEHEPEAAELSFVMASKSAPRDRKRSIQEQSADMHNSPNVSAVLEHCGNLDFDSLCLCDTEAKDKQIFTLGSYLMQYRGNMFFNLKMKNWIADEVVFGQVYLSFLSHLDGLYKPEVEVPYHNASHATDVMATMDLFMRTRYYADHTLTLDHFMALTAAAVHDVGHPGTNALFHKKMMSELSIRYNDKSILENMHCSLAFETMKQEECNWLRLLARAEDMQGYVRHGIILMVLATDNNKHAKQLQKFTDLIAEGEQPVAEVQSQADKQRALDNKLVLLAMALHAADLSNPSKPGDIFLKWTKKVNQEMWLQGDQERLLGLQISPGCDRHQNKDSVPQNQLGFINFVIMPMYTPLAELVQEIDESLKQLKENVKFWEEKKEAKATFLELFGEEE